MKDKSHAVDLSAPEPASNTSKRKKIVIGPGIVLAATGIGAGEVVISAVTGAEFGLVLIWAVVLGALLKFALTEGVGRWTLATGQTIMEGWRSLGKWTMGYFFLYVTLFGLIYGAAIATACGLMAYAMFPAIPVWSWAILHSIAGFILIWFSRYKLFERMITILIGIMFVTVIGSAIMLIPSLSDLPAEAFIPGIPDSSIYQILAIVGGLGGTMALAAYGYWVREKGWQDKHDIPVMRIDASIAYIVTGLFCVAMMIISTQFLYGTSLSLSGAEGMRDFLGIYGDRFGTGAQIFLNIGFWAATFSSMLGSWNGIPYLFADFIRVRKLKNTTQINSANPVTEKDPAYRFFLAWLTFPSMLLLIFDQPVSIVMLYSALGSLFMPFVAITLLVLLNSRKVHPGYRNKFIHNAIFVFVLITFIFLGVMDFV
ncbi:Nramp family divalent metal transporter [Lentibacillus salicampi]|uniref:Divalent metal cation transporter n=1 Tax=Lentibacillus salicampi TaxID=175306 RepID=A0A4Y9A7C4_9BACI|nr:Nramp family divalent metal transporter [Lentibacillus salicampi]TFJ91646.1 divalent metal cation transporter [Lentibacillus salicampi]